MRRRQDCLDIFGFWRCELDKAKVSACTLQTLLSLTLILVAPFTVLSMASPCAAETAPSIDSTANSAVACLMGTNGLSFEAEHSGCRWITIRPKVAERKYYRTWAMFCLREAAAFSYDSYRL